MKHRALLGFVLLVVEGQSLMHAAIVETLQADGIVSDRAVLRGAMMPKQRPARVAFQIRQHGARRWVGHTPWQKVPKGQTNIAFSALVANLGWDTEYEARAITIVGGGRRNGGPVSFHSASGLPTIASPAVTDITSSNAVLSASVIPNAAATTVWFEWGVTTSYGNTSLPASLPQGLDAVLVEAILGGLLGDADYHCRLVASNAAGVTAGTDISFHSWPSLPAIVSTGLTNITSSSAVLSASVIPNATATTVWFEWGTTTNYGNATGWLTLPAGVSAMPVTSVLENLPIDTRYYFRLVASNVAGVRYGAGESFFATDFLTLQEGDVWTFTFTNLPLVNSDFSPFGGVPYWVGSASFNFLPNSFSATGALQCETLNTWRPFVTTVYAPSDGGGLATGDAWGYTLAGTLRFTMLSGSVVLTNVTILAEYHNTLARTVNVYATNVVLMRSP